MEKKRKAKKTCGTCRWSTETKNAARVNCTVNAEIITFSRDHRCDIGLHMPKESNPNSNIEEMCDDRVSICNPARRSGKECMGCGG